MFYLRIIFLSELKHDNSSWSASWIQWFFIYLHVICAIGSHELEEIKCYVMCAGRVFFGWRPQHTVEFIICMRLVTDFPCTLGLQEWNPPNTYTVDVRVGDFWFSQLQVPYVLRMYAFRENETSDIVTCIAVFFIRSWSEVKMRSIKEAGLCNAACGLFYQRSSLLQISKSWLKHWHGLLVGLYRNSQEKPGCKLCASYHCMFFVKLYMDC